MAILLGVDTGGTYTDAVLMQDEARVLARAKALTTRHDLAVGVGEAVRAVLAASGVQAEEVGMASLSTTLATNALVEGQGGRVALIYIGFREKDLAAQGLAEALGDDPVCVLAGGHGHDGAEVSPLDETALLSFLETHSGDVSGFAVAAQFATRNPAHELRAMEMVREVTGRPVSASHQLSAKLGGPKRALTAVLNARLIGMIDALIGRAEAELRSIGITAPMMVVRGDGALMSSAQARARPIETILSGPAASIVGARWLTGTDHALVSDIGGTTTDVAVLRGGRPVIDPDGARVGPHRTMVEAVAMRTTGLGGDSEVHFVAEGLQGGVTLGPRRVLPVSLIAHEAPDVVLPLLEAQMRSATPGEHDGRFVRTVPGVSADGLVARDAALLERIGDRVHGLGAVLRTRMDQAALKRLVARGLVQVAGLTPSDASHVLGYLSDWDAEAARMACALFGRRRTGAGERLAVEPEQMARIVVDRLTHQTGVALLQAALAEDGLDEDLATHALMQRGLSDARGLVRVSTGLDVPVVGLGASARAYYPAVGERLGCEMQLPEDGGVANAIGAVVGRVTVRRSGTVTAPSEGRFRVHLPTGPEDFAASEVALAKLETVLAEDARAAARAAGAFDIELRVSRDIRTVQAEAREVFVEATLTAEAAGRPRIA
ncbi:hydantoinase/oxoprolinase family protein [Tateyamaria sp. ANG-S1]|uniref:hydantoinase/oxoprolinase N-terminal domain-containing protein n=1 Tax=Tateyamaria sp. ANG-S1 TaxID=1577905 RepID=UPI00057D5B9D|nr:hydantoinase/oxoprolinase family protein [Tateyamaria sp. ANG-S1]KIC49682.1 hydantoinase [Tateyamaria sp. ANG-S1]